MPPNNCAAMKPGTSSQLNFSEIASAIVTAGFRWAPLIGPTHHTATNTAMPQPKVITIQPEPLPFVFGSTTFATTPLPRSTKSAVPMNSAKYCFMTTYKSLIFRPTARAANGVAPSRANCGCLIGRHLWFETTIDFPMPSDGISTLPNTSGHPSQVRGAKRRRLRYLRPNNRELHDIGLILQQRVVNRRAAVDAKLRHRIAGITSHRIGEV